MPETIALLSQAGINVWMLTGDKQETAMNIGYATRMLQETQDIIVITSETMHPVERCIEAFQKKRDELAGIPPSRERALANAYVDLYVYF